MCLFKSQLKQPLTTFWCLGVMVITCVLNDANIHLRHGQKQNPQSVCHAKTQLMSHHQENKNKQLPKFNFTFCGRCCFKNRLNQTVTDPPHFLCSWTGTEQRKSSWRLVECELLKRDWWSLCNSHMTRACTPTRSHTHTIYPLIKSLCINDKIILIASQLSEVVVGCNCPLHAWWRDASHLCRETASHAMWSRANFCLLVTRREGCLGLIVALMRCRWDARLPPRPLVLEMHSGWDALDKKHWVKGAVVKHVVKKGWCAASWPNGCGVDLQSSKQSECTSSPLNTFWSIWALLAVSINLSLFIKC